MSNYVNGTSMDTYRAFLAIIISFVILLGYQYFFVGFDQPQPVEVSEKVENVTADTPSAQQQAQVQGAPVVQPTQPVTPPVSYDRDPKEITVETDLFRAVISEAGGAVKNFTLKKYKATHESDSAGMELVKNGQEQGWPLQFSWGNVVAPRLLYTADSGDAQLNGTDQKEVRFTGRTESGLSVEKVYRFDNSTYMMDLQVLVKNDSGTLLQGSPQLLLASSPIEKGINNPANRFLFGGAAAFVNNELTMIKPGDYEEGPKSLQGNIEWAGYESNYFLLALVPDEQTGKTFVVQGTKEQTSTSLGGSLDTLKPGEAVTYRYKAFFGPKKQKMLKEVGHNLDKAVYFGWFTPIAKPTLWLLNFFYSFVGNYGVAIIMVTVLFKAAFWPISQKGMKSMKNMQKLQPKMAKIKEKYKDDPTKMNQEVMNLYKTYKVNPLGGCLPMVLQIPVFFALYKVLLQSIELRHAPFMLWITDLSAPDRLWLGFDIPYVGGLPVLTLLMGASMFLQQKMSPSTADPTQAKIMMFLPVVFTFMFINFSSGLVLYWFINNLLSILQQVLINRETNRKVTA